MKIQLLATKTGKLQPAFIEKATLKDMPLKKDGWNFNWRELFRENISGKFYKISLEHSPKIIEGMLLLVLMNGEMVEMKNIEIAPHNYGVKGENDYVAGCLISYACLKSKTMGLGAYKGFLSFESKTKLIPIYQKKYGAVPSLGQRMFIEEQVGEKLIKEYLNR